MESSNIILVQHYHAPCGELILGSFNGSLCLCDWVNSNHGSTIAVRLQRELNATFIEGSSNIISTTRKELDEYFAGKLTQFSIPLLFVGSEFQKRVWNSLLDIKYGGTISYSMLASKIGLPKAVRAVANANGTNAISVIVPCHRVIGSNGSLTGYGGSLPTKKYLLELEQKNTN